MKTSKPISTICYNTKSFLIDTLKTLQFMKIIQYWEFIEHLPDTDDKKRHIHLYFEPNKAVDTESLKSFFIEQDPLNPDKPFKIHHIQSSKYGDWYWYCLHDKDYLKSKMMTRNLHYTDADIVTSDIETHNYKVLENPLINYCQMSDLAIREQIYNAVNNGVSLTALLYQIKVPLGKIQSVVHFYNAIFPFYSPKKEINNQNISYENFKRNIQQIALGQAVATDDDPVFE